MTDETITNDDMLLARIVSNEADALEWTGFTRLAAQQPQAWERLARALRDELQMRSSLDDALRSADAIEIPEEAFDHEPIATVHSLRRRFGIGWSGWAAAAIIALAWVGLSILVPQAHNGSRGSGSQRTAEWTDPAHGPLAGTPQTTLASYSDPDHAYRDYLRLGAEEGRVLQELPMVMIDSRPVEAGQGAGEAIEVIYVRQVLERTRVNGAFQINRDDAGRPVPVRVDFADYRIDSDL